MASDAMGRFNRHWQPEPNSGCWLWDGATCSGGYGTFKHEGRTIGAHRASYLLHCGPIKPGSHVCHKCDNPACVNPAHLFLGNHAINNADKHRKGRAVNLVGEQHGRAKLTAAQAVQIARLVDGGETFKSIAARYGVTTGAIAGIASGRNWVRVTGRGSARQ